MLNKLFKIQIKLLQLLILITLPQVIYYVIMSWHIDTSIYTSSTFTTTKQYYTCINLQTKHLTNWIITI
jgi:hypothetical protein